VSAVGAGHSTFSIVPPQRRPTRSVEREPIFAIGTVLDDHYELRERLGSGGMADVYLAHDRWLDRNVAIKATTPALADHLAREARVLASFRHPGLVAAHGYGYRDRFPYIVLEHLPGPSLGQRLADDHACDGIPSVDEALGLTSGICEALIPLHARGLVHCDLKPGNVMCAPDRVVLIDFGLVWEPQRDGSRPASGSPPFMAPEAIRGTIRPGEERLIDVYAIGMILYCLIAGTPPFDDDSVVATMERQLLERARPLSSRRDDLPPRLSELTAELIDRDPSKRPPDVVHVRDALVGIPRRTPSMVGIPRHM
jgi:eukaryotic-like serine/threonine-protein kinase